MSTNFLSQLYMASLTFKTLRVSTRRKRLSGKGFPFFFFLFFSPRLTSTCPWIQERCRPVTRGQLGKTAHQLCQRRWTLTTEYKERMKTFCSSRQLLPSLCFLVENSLTQRFWTAQLNSQKQTKGRFTLKIVTMLSYFKP